MCADGFVADSQSNDYEWVIYPSLLFDCRCKGFYLSCLVLMAWSVNLSCVNVNFIIRAARLGVGRNGHFVLVLLHEYTLCLGIVFLGMYILLGHDVILRVISLLLASVSV